MEGVRAPIDVFPIGERPDRCPYSRAFTREFAESPCCPAFQAAAFTGTDLRNRPLGTTVTCQHLTVGQGGSNGGRFYPRCGLGSAEARLHWLATDGTTRPDIAPSLEKGVSRPHRAG
ncbi:MAG TPA: hypothetical protein VH498_09195 [Candidatus Dormibacteraeota bacterium]|nr:hypothetical protein [Candidatus Dormibacteraeota bacterium]